MIASWLHRSPRRGERANGDAGARRAELHARIDGELLTAQRLIEEGRQRIAALIEANARQISRTVAEAAPVVHAGWHAGGWRDFLPPAEAPGTLRVGSLLDTVTGTDLDVPLTVAFGDGRSNTIVIDTAPSVTHDMAGLAQSVVLRAIAAHPGRRVVILDAERDGTTFPYAHRLPDSEVVTGPADETLAALAALGGAATGGEPEAARPLLVICSFPGNYTTREIGMILGLCGRSAGQDTIIVLDEHAGTAGTLLLSGCTPTVLRAGDTLPPALAGLGVTLAYDDAPPHGIADHVAARLATFVAVEAPLPWSALGTGTEPSWTNPGLGEHDTASNGRGACTPGLPVSPVLRAAIGAGAGPHAPGPVEIELADPALGDGPGNLVVAGGPAVTRRRVLDALLAQLALAHAPGTVELELCSLGGAPGPLARWARLPHVTVSGERLAPGELLALLARSETEIERRRGALVPAPARLVVVDGLEALAPLPTEIAATLCRIGERGPGAGVHLVLASARYDVLAALIDERGALPWVGWWIAAPPTAGDTIPDKLLGAEARAGLAGIDRRPGRALVDRRLLRRPETVVVRTAELSEAERDEIVETLAKHGSALARADDRFAPRPRRTVHGGSSPSIAGDPLLAELLEQRAWDDADALAAIAEGLHPPLHWERGGRPRLIVVGDADEIDGRSYFALCRHQAQNVVAVLARREQRVGVLTGISLSALLSGRPPTIELRVADGGAAGDPVSARFAAALRAVGELGVRVDTVHGSSGTGELGQLVDALGAEVLRRHSLDPEQLDAEPTVLFLLAEPERWRSLQRVSTAGAKADSPLGTELRYVLMQGPAVGVHTVVAAATPAALGAVVADDLLDGEFRHRIVGRVATEDSFALVRSSRAAQIPAEDTARATLFDRREADTSMIRPFSAKAENGPALADDADAVAIIEQLAEAIRSSGTGRSEE